MPEKQELENVIISAVKHGVYEKDGHWWWELCRLSDEIEKERSQKHRVCPECDSEILPDQTCMMGHWCGEPVVPESNESAGNPS